MPRILAFGCSYVYGHGLPDCIGQNNLLPGSIPSKMIFASIIAKKLNYDFLNFGICGASNKKIVNTILNTVFKKDDVCIIHWSHIERHCVIQNNNIVVDINSWTKNKLNNFYYKLLYNEYDSFYTTANYIDYINLKLIKNKVKVININPVYSANYKFEEILKLIDTNIKITNYNIHDCKIDYAADNSHPGKNSHNFLAERLLKDYKNILL